jgi:hypothetical protein
MGMNTTLVAALFAANATQPLPDHLVIPDGQSTVTCPSVEAAQTMLTQHYRVAPAPNNYDIDTQRFFEGLRTTGCSQDSADRTGDVVIQSVVQRTNFTTASGTERYVLYRGINRANGKPLIGIVSEDGNNSFARTELAQFMVGRGVDGWLDARGNNPESLIFYRCETAAQASAVVAAMAGMESSQTKAFKAKLNKQLSGQKCRPAQDRYFVTALRGEAGNQCGEECYIALTALEALDRSGISVGLVYDSSLM